MKLMINIAFVVGLLGATGACKQPQQPGGSKTQSLDNFARNTQDGARKNFTENSCSGSFELAQATANRKSMEDSVEVTGVEGDRAAELKELATSTLRSVPTPLQAAFVSLGGRMEITPKTHQHCTENLSGDDLEFATEGIKGSVKSCWKIRGKEELVIYIDDAESAVRHGAVRSFGYLLSQFLANLTYDEARGELAWRDGVNSGFEEAKEDLAVAVLNDVSSADGYDLERYESMIGRHALEASATERETMNWQTSSRQRFADYVFAEAMDSYYCSDRTRSVMEEDFAEAYEEFEVIASKLEQLPSTPEEAEAIDGPIAYGSGGMNLTTQTTFLGLLGGLFKGILGGGAKLLGGLLGGGGGGGGGLGGLVKLIGGLF